MIGIVIMRYGITRMNKESGRFMRRSRANSGNGANALTRESPLQRKKTKMN